MRVPSIQPAETKGPSQGHAVGVSAGPGRSPSFEEVLRSQAAGVSPGLHFSAHAQQRLQSGAVKLSGEALTRLERAVDAAGEKGARDALVLMDDLALLVSISNRTVITAVDPSRRKNGVFTNIDSVVMA